MIEAIPQFELTSYGYGSVSVAWTDGERRYHFWLDEQGKPQDEILHSNPVKPGMDRRVNEHRALKQATKKWAPIIAGIVKKIEKEGLYDKALKAGIDKMAAEEAERLREYRLKQLARLNAAMSELPPSVRDEIEALPEATRIAFAVKFATT